MLTFRLGTYLWVTWIETASKELVSAGEARMAARTVPIGEAFVVATGEEMRHSMIVVSAAAHAVDGFYGSVHPLANLPPGLVRAWREHGPRRPARIVETLKLGFDLGAAGHRFVRNVPWLYKLRDRAVHHESQAREPVPHPTGRASVAQEYLDYSLENARKALDTAVDVITTCLESPRPTGQDALAAWTRENTHLAGRLRDLSADPF